MFFGTAADTDLAHDMVTMLQGAIQHDTNARLMTVVSNEHPARRRASFEHGMTERLDGRLLALKRARTEADKTAREALATEQGSRVPSARRRGKEARRSRKFRGVGHQTPHDAAITDHG